MARSQTRPLRHISIRVPWHDSGWDGRICKAPKLNAACLRLPLIAEKREEEKEVALAGRLINSLPNDDWPCCVRERSTFMAPFEFQRAISHPYSASSPETHGHLLPTIFRHPSYSAAALPFNWMFKEELARYREEYQIDVDEAREPDLDFHTAFVQDRDNQLNLLNCFFDHIYPDRSLCFFYAKEVPFVEDSRRVLVGVGRVLHIGEPIEYLYRPGGKLKSMIWERAVQHSIRPDMRNGFLMPYQTLVEFLEKNPDFDPRECTAFAPEDKFIEFSYASEHVSHDGAIDALLSCASALSNCQKVLPGNYQSQIKWLHDRLAELWQMRGPCPGLGAALCAFGIDLGIFVAREIEAKLDENEDPWPWVEKIFTNPKDHLSIEAVRQIGETLQKTWKRLPAERLALLKLTSRFNLSPEQAKLIYVQEERARRKIEYTDKVILENPYLVFEMTRLTADPIGLKTVDRGIFPDAVIRDKHPLPPPSEVDTGTDSRRVRAYVTYLLERAATEGHTLQTRKDIIQAIRDLNIEPKCEVTGDLILVAEDDFGDAINCTDLSDGTHAYQLQRLTEVGSVVRNCVNNRRRGKRLSAAANWRSLLDANLPLMPQADEENEQESRARVEKTAALKELAESRISVLIGPAGTGKTLLLAVLCSHPEISSGGILLLAPTGKARVRMEQAAKEHRVALRGFTIAQFLSRCGRYDGSTGQYRLSTQPKETPAKTLIIDEASMLTEEMLAAVIDGLSGVERLILIGDPRQLPPIGAGRPFVDIISELAPQDIQSRFPKVGPGYAELTVRRRQAGKLRDDRQLADWFSGIPLEPGEDEVLDRVIRFNQSDFIELNQWGTNESFQTLLGDTIIKELSLKSQDDISGFDRSLGAKTDSGNSYFNRGAAKAVEGWQILSPVRKLAHGVEGINRLVHKIYRSEMIKFAQREKYRKIPKPMGADQIVYGDKVINNINHTHDRVYPKDGATQYIANGEIGLVVGQFWTPKLKHAPRTLQVEFSSQPDYSYDFHEWDFSEESSPKLELAFALTVHKAQGSEFGKVILCLPNPCRLLSRELLYTALTRQTDRIVILHQGNYSEIKKFASDEFSETARRLTNLFQPAKPIEFKGRFYEERLIHKTMRGELVRSKSELLISDRLSANNVDYMYEKPLTLDNETRYPDFTIEDMETGRVFYWEHCGMMLDPEYRKRWERKLAWYRKHDIVSVDEGEGRAGTLIVTTEAHGFSSREIDFLIKNVILSTS